MSDRFSPTDAARVSAFGAPQSVPARAPSDAPETFEIQAAVRVRQLLAPAAMVPTLAPPPVAAPFPALPTQEVADAAVAPLEPAEAALFSPPAMTETATPTVPIVPTVAAAPVLSPLLTALLEPPVELPTTTTTTTMVNDTTSKTKTTLAPTPTPTPDVERAPPAVVRFELPQEVADQELVLHDRPTEAYRAALMKARHAAWGRMSVPNDTVLRIILCLHGQNNGRRFLLESSMTIVDVVLRALACHEDNVVAAFDALTRAWMPRYALFVAVWGCDVVPPQPCAIDTERRLLSFAFPWTPATSSGDGDAALVDPVVA